ncbi:hypothetical protein MKK58_01185 [Methylobacterium sp. J-078]|uniref:hypothetical protein n=1 Tax=Methylobacterium sp. J-078 TaxID=2836657 RepID=UPI001FB8F561|nr:hypothetical protein [Methylobacterium sp. J-078]MCJ2043169.1 hypothetical protein [Methylobacterium sp. J-078]
MRRTIALFAAVMRLTLAAMAAAPKLVWEGGKWIARSFAPPAQAAQAESALMAEVEDLVAETETKAALTAAGVHRADVPADFHADLGRAAIQFLADAEHEDPSLAAMLDEEAKEYLINLPRDRQSLLVNYRPAQIGRHLTREAALINMPRVPTFKEYRQALYDRMEAEGLRPDPRIVQSIRKADVDETPEDGVRYGMR